MYGDQSGEFVFVPTWDVVACLGGVERGRGGEGRREGGRLGIEGGSPFSIALFPPLPTPDLSFFSAPAAQVRLLVYTGAQEPITRIVQLPCAHVTAFSRTSLLLERFWREF